MQHHPLRVRDGRSPIPTARAPRTRRRPASTWPVGASGAGASGAGRRRTAPRRPSRGNFESSQPWIMRNDMVHAVAGQPWARSGCPAPGVSSPRPWPPSDAARPRRTARRTKGVHGSIRHAPQRFALRGPRAEVGNQRGAAVDEVVVPERRSRPRHRRTRPREGCSLVLTCYRRRRDDTTIRHPSPGGDDQEYQGPARVLHPGDGAPAGRAVRHARRPGCVARLRAARRDELPGVRPGARRRARAVDGRPDPCGDRRRGERAGHHAARRPPRRRRG